MPNAVDIPIIVTRAEPGARETAKRLQDLGLRPIIASMLSFHARREIPIPAAEALSGIVFTSANGVRAYADRGGDFEPPAWCVGPATALAARQAGFATVKESAGDALDLARYIADQSAPAEKPLLHIANKAAAGTLKSELERFGFGLIFAPIYEMKPASLLPQDVEDLILTDRPCVLLVHSAKGAQAFAALVKHHALRRCALVAISNRAREPLDGLQCQPVAIAAHPNEDGLIDALQSLLATLSA
ncbi:MAG: uroporphyrinogen-III synthase [Pseudomonadota bacterium]